MGYSGKSLGLTHILLRFGELLTLPVGDPPPLLLSAPQYLWPSREVGRGSFKIQRASP